MKSAKSLLSRLLVVAMFCSLLNGQQTSSSAQLTIVPRLVNFSGKATDAQGKAVSGIAGATFAIYKDQNEGAPLWIETQNVAADSKGNYIVQLGGTKPEGLPLDLFTSGEARWLGVTINGGQEQPRVLLLSVPYALKAADAETIGGLPPTAFMLATPSANSGASASISSSVTSSSSSAPPPASSTVTTTGGTVNALPLWTTSTNIQSSIVTQSGSGSSGKLGVNTATPASTLDVNGAQTVRGNLSLPATGTATATSGKSSQPATLTASVFNKTTGTAVPQNFRWQAEAVNNDQTTASGTLNLLFGTGSNPINETGLKIASNGTITFAKGQTYPGAGTVTSVGLSAPSSDFTVSGSPVTNSGTLALNWNVAPTSSNSSNTIVKRDATSSFAAGSISAVSLTAANPSGLAIVASTSAANGAVVGTNSGTSAVADGVDGVTSSGAASGVAGINNGNGTGVYGTGGIGVYGIGASQGVYGVSTVSYSPGGQFYGYSDPSQNTDGGSGVVAYGGTGMTYAGAGGIFYGETAITYGGDGIDAYGGYGGAGGVYAGNFAGDVNINGTVYTGAKDFKIDHPLDPANKYLYHASVESSEMKNIYDGVVTTDAQGEATIPLPDWFEVLNTDFRYQLTVIGQFAQAIVAHEIQDHEFAIRTSASKVKVSWQVTGVRQDPYAKAHPLMVEKEKEERLKGFYIYPELYGAPAEKQIEWARHPEMMKRMKEWPVLPHPAVRPAARVKNLQASY